MHYIWCKLNTIVLKIGAPSKSAIWDEFSDEHQQQSTKRASYSMPNLMQIKGKFNAHFGWKLGCQDSGYQIYSKNFSKYKIIEYNHSSLFVYMIYLEI